MNKNKGLGNSLQNTAPLLCSQIALNHIKNGAANTVLERGITTKVLSSKSSVYYAHLYKEYTLIPIRVHTPVKTSLASQLEVHSYSSNLAVVGGAA